MLFDFWSVPLWGVGVEELTIAGTPEVALFILAPTVLDSLVGLAVETLHHSSIVQRRERSVCD